MNTHNSSGFPTQSRACPIVSASQDCQFAERITQSCALRSNHQTMFPSISPLEIIFSVRFVFLNYQSRKHQRKRTRSRPHVFTAVLDNARDHRAGTNNLTTSKPRASPASRASHCYPASIARRRFANRRTRNIRSAQVIRISPFDAKAFLLSMCRYQPTYRWPSPTHQAGRVDFRSI